MAKGIRKAVVDDIKAAMAVRPHWRSFDDYLADLTSNYRSKAKKLIKQVEDAGYRVERGADASAHDARLHALYGEAEIPRRHAPVGTAGRLLRRAACTRGPGAHALLADPRRRHRVRLHHHHQGRRTRVGYYAGFDYDVNARVPLNLRLLQTLVVDTIDLRCTELSFGRTAMEPKASLGATARSSHVWLRHRVPAVNARVREIFSRVQPGEAPQRNPFKEGATKA